MLSYEMVADEDNDSSHLLKFSLENDSCIVDSWKSGIILK